MIHQLKWTYAQVGSGTWKSPKLSSLHKPGIIPWLTSSSLGLRSWRRRAKTRHTKKKGNWVIVRLKTRTALMFEFADKTRSVYMSHTFTVVLKLLVWQRLREDHVFSTTLVVIHSCKPEDRNNWQASTIQSTEGISFRLHGINASWYFFLISDVGPLVRPNLLFRFHSSSPLFWTGRPQRLIRSMVKIV